MSHAAVPPLQGDWTLEDLQALPDDGRRYEIVDGALLVLSPSTQRHDYLAFRLARLLHDALPPGLLAWAPGGVQMGRTVRVPDVIVARGRARDLDDGATPVRDVVLLVEVESPWTRTNDRVTKAWEYARAGIGHYWRVEPHGPTVEVHVLAGDAYRLLGRYAGEEEVALTEPVALRFRPADLLR